MNQTTLLAVLISAIIFPNLGCAQPERYELGRRLRAFETAWEKAPGDESSGRCVEPLKDAVQSFFSFRLSRAAEAIDRARYAVESDKEPAADRIWAESLAIFPDKRLLDVREDSLRFELRVFYEKPRPPDSRFTLRCRLLDSGGKELANADEVISELPHKSQLPLWSIPAGDHRLKYEIVLNDKPIANGSIGISFVERLNDRLTQLEKLAAGWIDADSTERATFRAQTRLVSGLAGGKSEETDYPASRIISELDSLARAIQDHALFFNRSRGGQFWLALVTGRDAKSRTEAAAVRILVPRKVQDNSLWPLVVALHGAGGKENLFFDGYGSGKIVSLCEQRDWMLVAPRCGQFGGGPNIPAMIDELLKRYPIDPTKVFLVGHSMGAALAIQAACQNPNRFAGVVALGGSGFVRKTDELKKVPFFVGCGTEDFALSGARSLKDRLIAAGVERVSMREFKSVEHLGIVQQALPEGFRMFDEIVHSAKSK